MHENLPKTSTLYKYWLLHVATGGADWSGYGGFLSKLPRNLLLEVTLQSSQLVHEVYKDTEVWLKYCCSFHEHSKDEAKVCPARRPDDNCFYGNFFHACLEASAATGEVVAGRSEAPEEIPGGTHVQRQLRKQKEV
jgi:hypothetical protein